MPSLRTTCGVPLVGVPLAGAPFAGAPLAEAPLARPPLAEGPVTEAAVTGAPVAGVPRAGAAVSGPSNATAVTRPNSRIVAPHQIATTASYPQPVDTPCPACQRAGRIEVGWSPWAGGAPFPRPRFAERSAATFGGST